MARIKRRIEQKGIDVKAYEIYLQLAEKGLFPSVGFGIGIERQKQEEKRLKRLARHKKPLSGDEEPTSEGETPEGQEPETP